MKFLARPLSWLFFACLLASLAQAQFVFTPSTTLTQETSNNTSAADTFTAQSNGNAAAGNVSKLDVHSLLYPGATTQLYGHFMPWFGQSKHMDVGYSSDDPTQVHNQVSDMISRGLNGLVIDWYGPNMTFENNSALLVVQDLATRGGPFRFAVMEDKGALLACSQTAGCDITQQFLSDLDYAYTNFEQSPSYLWINGRPVVFTFDVETDYPSIDWTIVAAQAPANPIFIFRNAGGYTRADSGGAFAWIDPINVTSTDPADLAYLDNVYWTAQSYPNLVTFGSGYKGFNDSLASWAPSPPRIMDQQCGQTWLESFGEAGKWYSSSHQLAYLQTVTWNDYEEGTEIETGIDNCLSVQQPTVNGNTVAWTLSGTGQESTIDHYNVFLSQDGQQLMDLGQVASGTRSFDLSPLGLPAATTYIVFVQAAGLPTFQNKMSPGATFTTGTPPDQPPLAALSVTPTSGTAPLAVSASTAASTDPDGTIASSSIAFGDGSAAVAGPTASHTYSSAGTYTVTATVTDNAGLTSTATQAVSVSAPPTTACSGGTTNRTVTICTPAAGSTVSSPVSVTAAATDSASVSVMQVYLDGQKVYQAKNTRQISTSITAAAGSHQLTVQAKDSKGYFKTSVSFTVASSTSSNPPPSTSPCALSTVNPSVTICSPANNATVSDPVDVVAGTTDSNPVQYVELWVDGVKQYSVSGGTLNYSMNMATGTRRVTVQAEDSAGTLFKQTIYITVQS